MSFDDGLTDINTRSRRERLEYFLLDPERSIEKYISKRRSELGRRLSQRKIIYLDTNFWINLRDADQGISSNNSHLYLLNLMRRLVKQGLIFCPLSVPLFLEFSKQGPQSKRLKTAKLVDELSLGVAFEAPDRLQEMEIETFVRLILDAGEDESLRNRIWLKAYYTFGVMIPSDDPVPKDLLLAIQKGCFEEIWSKNFTQMVEELSDDIQLGGPLPGSSPQQMNLDVQQNAQFLKSKEQTYKIEIDGIVDATSEMSTRIFSEIVAEKSGFTRQNFADEEQSANKIRNIISFALKRRPHVRKILRRMHIGASLHAAFRWNKGQKFKPNDLLDFEHATFGLAYCDAFFTEGPLGRLISERLELDKFFKCSISINTEDAIVILNL